jgi:hypothetical protein
MTDPKPSDHWELLASELGARPPFEEREEEDLSTAEQPDTTEAPVPPEAPPVDEGQQEPPPKRQRPAPGWDALATEWGLEPEPAVRVPSPAERPPVGASEGPALEPPVDEPGEAETGTAPGDLGEQPAWITQQSTTRFFEGQAALFEAPAGMEMEEKSPEAARVRTRAEEVHGEVAGKKPSRRGRKRRRKPKSPGAVAPDQPRAETAGDVHESALEEPPQAEPAGTAGQSDQGRSKRRRKRPATWKKKRSPAGGQAVSDEEVAADQPEEGRPAPERATADGGKPPKTWDEDAEPAEGTAPSRPGHRAIPTWEEAVGLMISVNLEARARSPSGGSSRGRGKGRGSSTGKGTRAKPPEKKQN